MKQSLLILTLLFFFASPGVSQSVKTGRGNSFALVGQGSGMLTFVDSSGRRLSYENNSFLTVKIGQQYYTNNSEPDALATRLRNPSVLKANDTINTIWPFNDLDIVQQVYPVFFGGDTKIAVRFFLRNKSNGSLTANARYLLDQRLGSNDRPVMYEPNAGTTMKWRVYNTPPQRLQFTEMTPLLGMTGVTGEMQWRSPIVNLLPAKRVIVGDWYILMQLDEMPPAQIPTNNINDISVNTEWNDVAVPANSTREIGSFLYGSAHNTLCPAEITSLRFHPQTLLIPPGKADSVLGYIDAYLYNTSDGDLQDFRYEMNAEGEVRFHPDLSSATLTSSLFRKDSVLPASFALTARKASSSGSIVDTAFSGTLPVLTGSCPVTIATAQYGTIDNRKPIALNVTQARASLGCSTRVDTVVVSDSTAFLDGGIAAVSTIQIQNYDVRYLTNRAFPSAFERIELRVIDTMENASIKISARDVSGNASDTITIEYCTTADVLAPLVTVNQTTSQTWTAILRDDRGWDRFLRSIDTFSTTNIRITSSTQITGLPQTQIGFAVIDSTLDAAFCFIVRDRADNATTEYCFTYEGVEASVGGVTASAFKLYPNPANASISVELPEASRATGRIVDMTGNVIWNGSLEQQNSVDVSAFASGSYIFVIEASGSSEAIQFSIAR
jgi:hypothetical protein